jgi:hypothetical protein
LRHIAELGTVHPCHAPDAPRLIISPRFTARVDPRATYDQDVRRIRSSVSRPSPSMYDGRKADMNAEQLRKGRHTGQFNPKRKVVGEKLLLDRL